MFRSQALFIASCALATLTTAACATSDRSVRVQAEETSAPSVTNVKTYAFGSSSEPPARYRSSSASVEALKHMQPMIEEDLKAKGYVPATSIASADIVWMFAAGRRDREMHVHNQEHSDVTDDDPEEEFVEGALIIDALDGKTGKRVWHGFGRSDVDPTKLDDGLLRKAVDKIMARFPAVSGNASAPAKP